MKQFNLFKQKKMKVFMMSDMDKVKNGILVLDENEFNIVNVILENGLEDYENEVIIEEEIEKIIPDYEPHDYIEKHIVLKITDSFTEIMVILLKRDKVSEIINEIWSKNINLEGIIPKFCLEFLKKDSQKTILSITTSENKLINTIFDNHNIIQLSESYISIDNIENQNIVNSLKFDILSMISQLEEENIVIDEIRYDSDNLIDVINSLNFNGEIKKISFNHENDKIKISKNNQFNFIPEEYQKIINRKKTRKIATVSATCVIAFEIVMYIVFGKMENKYNISINSLDEKIVNIANEINEKKDEIENLETYEEKIEILKKAINKNTIKFSDILKKIEENNKENITFEWLEYNGNDKLQIRGKSDTDNNIYTFEDNISKDSYFLKLNHDYIRRKDNLYEFQIDIGININNEHGKIN